MVLKRLRIGSGPGSGAGDRGRGLLRSGVEPVLGLAAFMSADQQDDRHAGCAKDHEGQLPRARGLEGDPDGVQGDADPERHRLALADHRLGGRHRRRHRAVGHQLALTYPPPNLATLSEAEGPHWCQVAGAEHPRTHHLDNADPRDQDAYGADRQPQVRPPRWRLGGGRRQSHPGRGYSRADGEAQQEHADGEDPRAPPKVMPAPLGRSAAVLRLFARLHGRDHAPVLARAALLLAIE